MEKDFFWKIFRDFFVNILGNYNDFLQLNNNNNNNNNNNEIYNDNCYKFNVERFLKSQSSDRKRLMEIISTTSMFTSWVIDIELSKGRSSIIEPSLFEREISDHSSNLFFFLFVLLILLFIYLLLFIIVIIIYYLLFNYLIIVFLLLSSSKLTK